MPFIFWNLVECGRIIIRCQIFGGVKLTNNIAFLIFIGIVLFIAIVMVLYRTNPKCRYLSSGILCILLFSIISTISLGVNYIAAFIGKQDGIALTTRLAKLIIGEGRWSVELFLSYFEAFTTFCMILLLVYFVAFLYENKRQYKA
jgi:hypothetical protein